MAGLLVAVGLVGFNKLVYAQATHAVAVSASWCGPCQGLLNSTNVTLNGTQMTVGNAYKDLAAQGKLNYYSQNTVNDVEVWQQYNPATKQFENVSTEQATNLDAWAKNNSFPYNSQSPRGNPLNDAQKTIDNINKLPGDNAPADALKPENAQVVQDYCAYVGFGPHNLADPLTPAAGPGFIQVKGNPPVGYDKFYGYGVFLNGPINMILEKKYPKTLQQQYSATMASAREDSAINKGQKITIIVPTAQESLAGKFSNSMLPGKYRVGQPSKAGEQGIPAGKTMSPACEPVDGKIPELPGSEGNPFPGLGGPGGGGAPGSSMLGGLGQMLPLLLAGMLGGGQGQQGQGQNGQNQYGAGYGNQQQDQCLYQPADPVCGDDGKSYRNAYCANQYRARIRNNGVCIAVTPTPIANTIAITSLSPLKGAVGSTIVITGSGFSAMGNSVHFGEGGSKNISSIADGRVILFDVPQDISGCDFWPSSGISCTQPARTVTPDTYSVMVTNASGQNSNEKSFTVTTGKADVFPTAVRDSIKNIISTIFANIFGGAHVGETVIR